MFANVDHGHPEVRRDLFYWIQWLAAQITIGGLRLDAIKHYSATFLKDFVNHIDATVGRDWFLVGEYWREDSDVLAKYIEYMNHRLCLFDVRLVSNFSRLSLHPNTDLRTVFAGSLVNIKPRNTVVSLLGDRVRFVRWLMLTLCDPDVRCQPRHRQCNLFPCHVSQFKYMYVC